jgi:hypothetical protein
MSDDGILVEMRGAVRSYDEIAETLGRTRAACQQRAVIIGATRSLPRGVADDEDPRQKCRQKRRACLRCGDAFSSDGAKDHRIAGYVAALTETQ